MPNVTSVCGSRSTIAAAALDGPLKGRGRLNQVIGGHHHHGGVGIFRQEQRRRQADRGRRVAFAGLAHDPSPIKLRQLSGDRLRQAAVGNDPCPLRGHELAQSIDRGLDHRPAPRQVQQLLGASGPAERPKPRAAATGHDDGVEHGMRGQGSEVRSRRSEVRVGNRLRAGW